jgi:RNA polymerase sigma factor (sigma-70 family)
MTVTHNITLRDNVHRPKASDADGKTNAADLERLVAAAAEGDHAAVTELVDRFAGRIRRVARSHRLAAHDVEDVVQTTWLRLLQHVDTIVNPNGIGAWLEITARRESLRVLKANSRERLTDTMEAFDAPVASVVEQRLPSPERCAVAINAALEQLTGHQRELMLTLFSDPMPAYDEVSRTLDMPVGSIGPTRTRALARLRQDRDLRSLADEYLLDAA